MLRVSRRRRRPCDAAVVARRRWRGSGGAAAVAAWWRWRGRGAASAAWERRRGSGGDGAAAVARRRRRGSGGAAAAAQHRRRGGGGAAAAAWRGSVASRVDLRARGRHSCFRRGDHWVLRPADPQVIAISGRARPTLAARPVSRAQGLDLGEVVASSSAGCGVGQHSFYACLYRRVVSYVGGVRRRAATRAVVAALTLARLQGVSGWCPHILRRSEYCSGRLRAVSRR